MTDQWAKEEPHILARLRRGERIEHHETVRRRKNGELFPVSLTISAIRDSNGAKSASRNGLFRHAPVTVATREAADAMPVFRPRPGQK